MALATVRERGERFFLSIRAFRLDSDHHRLDDVHCSWAGCIDAEDRSGVRDR